MMTEHDIIKECFFFLTIKYTHNVIYFFLSVWLILVLTIVFNTKVSIWTRRMSVEADQILGFPNQFLETSQIIKAKYFFHYL